MCSKQKKKTAWEAEGAQPKKKKNNLDIGRLKGKN